MTPARWEEVKRVLADVMQCEQGSERIRCLEKACAGDDNLRREVESLLKQSGDRWDEIADDALAARGDLGGMIGRRIGAYVIVREIGRGGMGAVYLAGRDDQEFKKEVAIKLLKRGTDTEEVLRRFRAEREILARLQHPNIAQLLDGGSTEEDLPYVIMEYVTGVPVNEFCQGRALSVEQRLELFLRICRAVRFAHQNLVVHRDLKPANILVNEDGEPKLLDFGIAKLLEPGEAAFDLTMPDQQRLTPAYASPEQVKGEPITTVSDIYSLGAVLYEILSGRPAHVFSSERPTPTELLRVVTEQEPLRPSAVASDPAMRRRLKGDLDTIVLKALRKERERRYGGVGDLAEDVRLYLADRPIRARPDTVWYRGAKLIQRNKLATGATALVIVTLVGSVVVTLRAAREARIARRHAEQRFDDLRKVANSFMLELHNAIKDLPGSLQARQLLIRRALGYLDSLAGEAGGDLNLKNELAMAYEKLGLVTFDVEQALTAHRKAVALNEELVAAEGSSLPYHRSLIGSYANLSDVLKISGSSNEAIAYARKAVKEGEFVAQKTSLAEDRRQLAKAYQSLEATLDDAGYARAATTVSRTALKIVETNASGEQDDTRELAESYGSLSDDLEETGAYDEAAELAKKAMELSFNLWKADRTNSRNQRNLWAAELRRGRRLTRGGDKAGAEESYRKAIEIIQGLCAADPSDRGHRYWMAETYLQFADFLSDSGRVDEALDCCERAKKMDEQLLAEDSKRAEVQPELVRIYKASGQLNLQRNRTEEGMAELRKADALCDRLCALDPENLRLKNYSAQVKVILAQKGSAKEAPQLEERALGLWRDVQRQGELRPEEEAEMRTLEDKPAL